jgi:amino acid transporter
LRTLAAAVLAFQSIVIALAIPVAISVYDVPAARAGWVGGVVAISCILVAGLLRHRWAYALGWAIQVVSILAGFVVPVMFVLGGIFMALWWGALTLGRKGEATQAHYRELIAQGLGPDGRPLDPTSTDDGGGPDPATDDGDTDPAGPSGDAVR